MEAPRRHRLLSLATAIFFCHQHRCRFIETLGLSSAQTEPIRGLFSSRIFSNMFRLFPNPYRPFLELQIFLHIWRWKRFLVHHEQCKKIPSWKKYEWKKWKWASQEILMFFIWKNKSECFSLGYVELLVRTQRWQSGQICTRRCSRHIGKKVIKLYFLYLSRDKFVWWSKNRE